MRTAFKYAKDCRVQLFCMSTEFVIQKVICLIYGGVSQEICFVLDIRKCFLTVGIIL